jgi:hypothetical protein
MGHDDNLSRPWKYYIQTLYLLYLSSPTMQYLLKSRKYYLEGISVLSFQSALLTVT